VILLSACRNSGTMTFDEYDQLKFAGNAFVGVGAKLLHNPSGCGMRSQQEPVRF